jgi:hypothetical protein
LTDAIFSPRHSGAMPSIEPSRFPDVQLHI